MVNSGVPAPLCYSTGDHSVYIPAYTDLQNRGITKQNKIIIQMSEPQVFLPWKFETSEYI